MSTPRCSSFTTTHRVVDGVHGDSPDTGPLASPALAAGLAHVGRSMARVAHLADGRAAIRVNHPQFAAGHSQGRPIAIDGDQTGPHPGGTGDTGSTSRLQLDSVHARCRRDNLQRHTVPRFEILPFHGIDQGIAHAHAARGEDVPFLTVRVGQQGNIGRPVGIVLNRTYPCRNIDLIPSKIDLAVKSFVPTSPPTRGYAAMDIAPPGLRFRFR